MVYAVAVVRVYGCGAQHMLASVVSHESHACSYYSASFHILWKQGHQDCLCDGMNQTS
jgi:hypothetical protein